jgi:hypothetical protein
MVRRKKDSVPVEPTAEEVNEIQHHKKRAFLAAYAETGNVTKAAQAADIDRSTHYGWLKDDKDYAEAFKHADEEAGDTLEAEARRRAVEGIEEPVFHQGMVVGTIRKYSDTLLIYLLNGSKPEKYKQRVHSDVTAKVDATVTQKPDLSKLSDEELMQLEQLLTKTAEPG